MAAPAVSVIIPVYNSESLLKSCLHALARSSLAPHEVIVVDDASQDGSAQAAQDFGARVIRLGRRQGPARARNVGAASATGDVLFFLDADVCVHADGIGRVQKLFSEDEPLAAVMGTYDDHPACTNFLSQYRNLMHAFYHRSGNRHATTFWTGCGAVRLSAFRKAGAFDDVRYPHSSIEDIELGYRMHALGLPLRLDPELQAQHLKRWTFWGMLRTDVFSRAIPWTELILERRRMPDDLNVAKTQRWSVTLALLSVVSLPFPLLSLLWLGLLTLLNLRFYRFLAERRGAGFAIRAIPLHWLYFLYSGAGFGAGVLRYLWGRATS